MGKTVRGVSKPNAIADLSAVYENSDSIRLTWSAPDNSVGEPMTYSIFYRINEGPWAQFGDDLIDTEEAIFDIPGNGYDFYMIAANFVDSSDDGNIAKTKYWITWIADGSEYGDELAIEYGEYIKDYYPTDNPTKTGYSFHKWTREDESDPGIMPTENITIVATWNINQYTITFDPTGGTSVESITRDYYTIVSLPDLNSTTRTGHTFIGWALSVDGDTITAHTLEDHVKLYAVWNANPYTITFNTAGGTPVDSITQDYDTEVAEPVKPSSDGYIFYGWFDSENERVTFPFNMPVNGLVLTAEWKIGISIPVGKEMTYNGTNQLGVDEGTGYVLETGKEQTNSDDGYTVIATLENGYIWIIPGEEGGTDTYSTEPQEIPWSIIKAELTITAEDETITFKDDEPEYTVICSGFVGGEDETVLGGELSFESGYTKNAYYSELGIEPSGLTSNNYHITFVEGKLTVNRKMIDIPEAVTGLIYDTSKQTGVNDEEGYILFENTEKDAGDYTATAALESGYVWSDGSDENKTIDWAIAKKALSDDMFTSPSKEYTGERLTPEINTNVENKEYNTDIGTLNTVNAKDYTVTITAKYDGNYSGIAYVTFTITKTSLNESNVSVEIDDAYNLVYDGLGKEPGFTVKIDNGDALVHGTDYIVSYVDNIFVGEATATIAFTNYELEIEQAFNITVKDISDAAVSITIEFEDEVLKVIIDDNGTPLTNAGNNPDYVLATEGDPLTKVTVNGVGNYTGSVSFEIYSISFINEDGSLSKDEVGNTITVMNNLQQHDAVVLNNPFKEGYGFTGWYIGTEKVTKDNVWSFVDEAQDNAITLIAVFEPLEFTIIFNENGGSGIDNAVIIFDSTIEWDSYVSVKEGHSLSWLYNGEDAKTILPKMTVADNIEVTAEWTVNQYTLTFVDYDGTVIDAITQDYGTIIEAPENPSREGYNFDGWSPKLPETMPAEDITVTAVWSESSDILKYAGAAAVALIISAVAIIAIRRR